MLNHENIVKMKESFETPELFCIVLEYIQGHELFYMLTSDLFNLNNQSKKLIFKQVAQACTYMHSLLIAHRDLKAENILIDSHYKVYLVDFGFSMKMDPESPLTSDHCGSTEYCSPEIVMRLEYDPLKADVWALGVLLFTIITGEMPFLFGGNISERKMLHKIARGDYTFPNEKEYDSSVVLLIQSMLATKPANRISMKQVLESEWLK
jgi:serine/threonine protein kinase